VIPISPTYPRLHFLTEIHFVSALHWRTEILEKHFVSAILELQHYLLHVVPALLEIHYLVHVVPALLEIHYLLHVVPEIRSVLALHFVQQYHTVP
jgi:hypothetical protein